MLFLSYAYRFLSNFVFLALVYFALNFLEKYQHRVVVAVLVLVYAGMHAASALRSFGLYRHPVPRHRHPALRRQDRDELSLVPIAESPCGQENASKQMTG
jgi:hypothetical protein